MDRAKTVPPGTEFLITPVHRRGLAFRNCPETFWTLFAHIGPWYLAPMKVIYFAVLLLFASSAAAAQKACIALESDSDRPELVRDALSTAVMLSGDYIFYPTEHTGCWTVREVSMAVNGARGYAISWVVTDSR